MSKTFSYQDICNESSTNDGHYIVCKICPPKSEQIVRLLCTVTYNKWKFLSSIFNNKKVLGPSSSRWLIKLVLYYYRGTCNCYLIILMGCIQLLVYFIGRCYSCTHLLRSATQNIISLLRDGIQIMISQFRGGDNNKFQRVCRYIHIPQSIATSTQCTPARTHTTTLQKPTTSTKHIHRR